MGIEVGDTVLVYYDLLIYDAEVLKIETAGDASKFLVHFKGWSEGWDEWIAQENVLEDTPHNRERQKKAKDELLVHNATRPMQQSTKANNRPTTLPGSERLVSMIGWMKTLDDSLTQLDKQKRKAEAEVHKAELEVEVARDLKRVKIAEETAMARKRLKDAGVSQAEIDAILPAAR
ncbi:hypothetical protein PInf_018319 [Phytophthora infestans]|nr:hypothetical protein PInf_018319 [Phytophthora infestans]